MRVRRLLSALVLSALAVTGLTACQTKVGLAASVNDVRLSDSDLSGYVKPGAAPYLDTSTNTTVVPKLYVLEVWIRTKLFDRAVAAAGAPVNSTELKQAESFLLGNGRTLGDVEKTFTARGYEPKLADLAVESSATLLLLVQRLQKGATLQQAEQLLSSQDSSTPILRAIAKSNPKVDVSSRYGKWSEDTLSLSADSTAGLPSFVKVPGAAAETSIAG